MGDTHSSPSIIPGTSDAESSGAPAGSPAPSPDEWPGSRREAFRCDLLAFFREHRRDLPWRDEGDPYPVLVSEVMLQQTRVETALPYFERWMERFPSLEALAAAQMEEVLGVWQGLGYYTRARNLHRSAREIRQRYGGEIPGDPEELRTLPGVGPYTAGAVASIAFGARVPAVDGNVKRVLARIMDDPDPGQGLLSRWAGALVPVDEPGEFNQALMELGSLVCRPRSPDCEACPVASYCRARAAGTQADRPRPARRKGVPLIREAVAVVRAGGDSEGRVLLRRREDRGLLAGMWELPGRRIEKDEDRAEEEARALGQALLATLGEERAEIRDVSRMQPLEHAFSHRRMRYLPFLLRTELASAPTGDGRALRWVVPGRTGDLPLPAAQRKLLVRLATDGPTRAQLGTGTSTQEK